MKKKKIFVTFFVINKNLKKRSQNLYFDFSCVKISLFQ